ncbi:serine hydrolase [Roseiarcaceae bacterium H3SJ34-1]|uniref:serine hydrolase n=1 Tax=Terripilifer ovatus TaxID=3032367 RepID=UPI003AB97734|nr:serine hydrolase [Roseiarcaceae bacterium H3SJ34-1]
MMPLSKLPVRRGVKCAALVVTLALLAQPCWPAALPGSDLSPPQTAGVPIPRGQVDKAVAKLDALARALLKRSGIPGMAVAVVKDGKTVYAKGFGIRKVGETRLVDADTVFQIASLSKSISATVVARQVGAGVVKWNTPVVGHLPWFALADDWVSKHVTIGDMFAHRSGLPDHSGDDLEDMGYDRRQVLERLRFAPLQPFRSTYAYTNFGLTAAAEAVAAASGTDWATLAETVLYKPLGMAATSSRFDDFIKQDNRAGGHVLVGGSYVPKYQRRPDAQSPAGGVSSTVRDLAKWMAMVLGQGRYEGREIIAEDALLQAMTAQIVSTPSFAVDARASFYGYGFGVGVSPAGRVTLSHSGAFALGAGTHYLMIPSAGVGIVILTNAWPIGVAETLGAEFADLVQFGAITRDWFPAYQRLLAPTTKPFGTLVGKAAPAGPAPAQTLSAYAGVYANDYYGDVVVEQSDRGLILKMGPSGVSYALDHWDGNEFVFKPSSENAPDGSISAATFAIDGATPARTLTIELLNENGIGVFARR